jgi:hypothetical protein
MFTLSFETTSRGGVILVLSAPDSQLLAVFNAYIKDKLSDLKEEEVIREAIDKTDRFIIIPTRGIQAQELIVDIKKLVGSSFVTE